MQTSEFVFAIELTGVQQLPHREEVRAVLYSSALDFNTPFQLMQSLRQVDLC